MSEPVRERALLSPPDGNRDTSTLKCLAFVFMLIDHTGIAFFGNNVWMRLLGRIAFPLYIWCAVVGCCYTRSMGKYLLKLLAAAVISQPFHMWAMNHTLLDLNVIFTLTLGVAGIAAIQYDRWGSRYWGPALALTVSMILGVNYGWRGVLMVMLLYACRERRAAVAAVMIAFCLFWGGSSQSLTGLFGLELNDIGRLIPNGTTFVQAVCRLQFFAILALPFILPRKKRGWKLPWWLGYAVYPGHLALIGLLKMALQ